MSAACFDTAALRDASRHDGPWPSVSVWHGTADTTVRVRNAEAVLAQWRCVHGLSEHPSAVDQINGATHWSWHSADGRVLLEATIVLGMKHGTPLKTVGEGAYGAAAPYMLDVDISSTARIARSWGLFQREDQQWREPSDAAPKAIRSSYQADLNRCAVAGSNPR